MSPARTLKAAVVMLLTACPATVARDDAGAGEGGGAGGSTGSGGGTSAGRLLFIDRTSGVPDPASLSEPDVTVTRDFECDESDLGAGTAIAETAGAPGEELVIRRTSTPCTFDLLYAAGGPMSKLSPQPSGYLFAAAARFSDGVRVACASEISHHGAATQRVADAVGVRCWASVTTAFTVSALAVAPAADSAAWVRSLAKHPTRPQAYVLGWARDFSFSVMNMGDRGRPATDGLYHTVLVWNGSSLVAEPATKVSPVTNPFASIPTTVWEPTAQDIRDTSGFIDFSGLDAGP